MLCIKILSKTGKCPKMNKSYIVSNHNPSINEVMLDSTRYTPWEALSFPSVNSYLRVILMAFPIKINSTCPKQINRSVTS